ncbi:MAG: PLP-dependent aminotransferase family protein [Gammaproteobacteria bacterium]|nr:PLP-dependent aminotransferase family protein [Gammaproteobacteria bacterium]MDE0223839.1 PLP-dependent aminotransferase family protein [Gammaproteobacteria bacterium]
MPENPMYENIIEIDRDARESLQQQIRRQIAIGIVNRQFPLSSPLPSVRRLARDLGVSVTTVSLAYAGLKQDGFVRSRRRAGYFVDRRALADPAHADLAQSEVRDVGSARMDYAAHFRGRSFDVRRVVKPPDCLVRYRYPFVCGLIDPAMFPISSWRECVRDSVNVVEVGNWATDYSATDDPMLVEQVIERVLSRRGIAAHPDEVLMTVGGQQALYLALKLLLQRGETFGVEDPGYPDMVNMARFEGMRVVRLPVDSGGLVLSAAAARCKCLYVTPSHQFPTTVTMPTERKLELLRLTRANGQFVIEDDYEADVSFNRTPPRALKSLDAWGNVVYVGSLSKSLLPGLRVGYLVADRDFVREARALRHHILRHPPVNNQRCVALFIARGYYDRFVAKLTTVYRERCDILHECLERRLPGAAVKPEYGGAIVWVRLPEDADADVLRETVEADGVFFEAGGFTFADERRNRNHMRLGYSVIGRRLIPEGVDRIADALPGVCRETARRRSRER